MKIIEAPVTQLADLRLISIAFETSVILEINQASGGSGYQAEERQLEKPFRKDYDAILDNGPADWAAEFDISNWGLLFAVEEGLKIGGALVAFDTHGVDMLEGRKDLAVLWDIRVNPIYRGKGIGTALFQAARNWAIRCGCKELKIETQNNNPEAVKFYLKQGCVLEKVVYNAYPSLPEEHMLLFYLIL
jgi:ribosomal protein S18 acetylase RimI-like enzyme